jgi:hypothetical protein
LFCHAKWEQKPEQNESTTVLNRRRQRFVS